MRVNLIAGLGMIGGMWAAMALATMTAARGTNLYDVMDTADAVCGKERTVAEHSNARLNGEFGGAQHQGARPAQGDVALDVCLPVPDSPSYSLNSFK
ncbi:hypothetical protein [Massilia sp. CCM 8734]|uniref:hypothetical protein n=1 Tax=Massilia sp. CCM 8734 TaxID=2609283 RepID=UPI0014202979|nr:hypothetical protein [Massilia sp. CCM 8734]NHZ94734.1 hypothetical protein [Massilia sp. CCM 8734]